MQTITPIQAPRAGRNIPAPSARRGTPARSAGHRGPAPFAGFRFPQPTCMPRVRFGPTCGARSSR